MTDGSGEPVYLVTGSMGCIGAWVLRHLVARGARTVSYDLSNDRRRLDLLLAAKEQRNITFVQGEITDFDKLLGTIREHGINRVVHLAALQIPFCRAEPVTGAHVNVVGTVAVFEAVRQSGLTHLSYASSIAVYGGEDGGEGSPGSSPDTLYGVYKQANEGTARVFWQDYRLSSIGLRPYTVYGVGRDQGLTSEPTLAMLAAAARKPYQISFGGRMQFHFASDVARQFIAAAERPVDGAPVFNLGSPPTAVAEVVALIRRLRPESDVSHVERRLPFAEGFDAGDLKRYLPSVGETYLEDGVRETIEQFESLLSEGRLKWQG